MSINTYFRVHQKSAQSSLLLYCLICLMIYKQMCYFLYTQICESRMFNIFYIFYSHQIMCILCTEIIKIFSILKYMCILNNKELKMLLWDFLCISIIAQIWDFFVRRNIRVPVWFQIFPMHNNKCIVNDEHNLVLTRKNKCVL